MIREDKTEVMVKVKEALVGDKPVLERLMQLYLYDFSELEGGDLDEEALFEYKYLDSYWTEPGRFPFLIHVSDKIAGFVLVNSRTCLQKQAEAKSIAEFFVMRKYRRQGVGRTVAFRIFDMFPGKWEVGETKRNVGAQRFWRRVIDEYTQGNFTETMLNNKIWRGPIQSFNNGHNVQASTDTH
jgi:predicted acetyltransferase